MYIHIMYMYIDVPGCNHMFCVDTKLNSDTKNNKNCDVSSGNTSRDAVK